MQIDRIGLSTASLRQPLKQALHTAARAGALGVQFDARSEVQPAAMGRTAIRHLRKLLDDLNLRVCGVGFPTRRGYGAAEALDQRLEATRSAMRLAHDLGSQHVILNVGPIGAEGSVELNTLVESLAALAGFADRVGARLAARTDVDNAHELNRVLSLLPEGALGIALDPASIVRGGASPVELVAAVGPFVSYVFASDAVRGIGGLSGREMELGRGSAELPAVLGSLEEFGYRGWVTIDRRETPLSVEQAENAVEYLRSL